MRKQLKKQDLAARPFGRALLAFSLTASLAAFGCSTNRTPGNGEPVRDGFVRTAPTGGVTGGSEVPTPPPLPPPMMSSSSRPEVVASPSAHVGADQAAAIMAQRQPVRVLGVVDPGPANRPYASDGVVTGQFRNPALITNPQVTVNSTISSQPTPVVLDGAGGTFTDASALVGAVTADGTVISNATIAGTTGSGLAVGGNVATTPPVIRNGNGTVAPTSVVSPNLTPGAFAGSSAATPTTMSSNIPTTMTSNSTLTPTTATSTQANTATVTSTTSNATLAPTTTANTATGNPATTNTATGNTATGNTATGNTATGNTATVNSTANTATTSSPVRALRRTSTSTTNPVRVTNANGRIVVTNTKQQ